MKTRGSVIDTNSNSESDSDQPSHLQDSISSKRKIVELKSWEAIQDIHNNNKNNPKLEEKVSKTASNGIKMANLHAELDDKCEKTSNIPQKPSPSRHSEASSPPIVSFHGQSNSITAGTIPKPLGLRIPNLPGSSSSIPHIPLFHPQRPAFFPWLYNQHTPPPSPLIGERSYGSTNQPISSSTNLPNGDMTNIVNQPRFLPPPFPPMIPPTLMNMSMPTPSGVDLSNVFPPGMPLGRGHELMRRLCAMNPQFASSVLEDYIRPQVRDGDIVLEIECGPNAALLYLSRLCQGSKGPCIWFQDSWLTPNEFQYISGRETAKDWKRSIRHCGKSMKLLLTKGILTTHPPICDCDGCRISSPVNRGRFSDPKRSDEIDESFGSNFIHNGLGIERDRLLFSEAQNMKMDKSKLTGSESRPEALLNQIIRKDISTPKEKKETRYSPSNEHNDNVKSFDDKDKLNLESDKESRNIDPDASVALNNGYLRHKVQNRNSGYSPPQLSPESLAQENRSRLTNIIDHLVIAQKRAESSGNNDVATTFVNEHLRRAMKGENIFNESTSISSKNENVNNVGRDRKDDLHMDEDDEESTPQEPASSKVAVVDDEETAHHNEKEEPKSKVSKRNKVVHSPSEKNDATSMDKVDATSKFENLSENVKQESLRDHDKQHYLRISKSTIQSNTSRPGGSISSNDNKIQYSTNDLKNLDFKNEETKRSITSLRENIPSSNIEQESVLKQIENMAGRNYSDFMRSLASKYNQQCSDKDTTEAVEKTESILTHQRTNIPSVCTSKHGPSGLPTVTSDTKSSSSIQSLQSSFQKQISDSTSMASAFPFLAAAGLASRSSFLQHDFSKGFQSYNNRIPTTNAMLDLQTQSILNMFRSAQQQHQNLIEHREENIPTTILSRNSSEKLMNLVKAQENNANSDIDVESTHPDDYNANNSMSEIRNATNDAKTSPSSTHSSLESSQNALDLRPRVTTRKDLFNKNENITLKRPYSGSSEQEEDPSHSTSSLLALVKRFKASSEERESSLKPLNLLDNIENKSEISFHHDGLRIKNNQENKEVETSLNVENATSISPQISSCSHGAKLVRDWTVDQVCQFVESIESCRQYAESFREQKVDGSILLMLREEHLMGTLMKMKLGEVLRLKSALSSKVGSCPICLHCIKCHKTTEIDSKSTADDTKLSEKYTTENTKSITSSSPEDKKSSLMSDSKKDCTNKLEMISKLEVDNIHSSNKDTEGNKQDVNIETDEDE